MTAALNNEAAWHTSMAGIWNYAQSVASRGVDPYGTGGTRPPQYLDRGGHDHECPPPIFLE